MQATFRQHDLFHLVVRPVSAEPDTVAKHLDKLTTITGLKKGDILRSMTGFSPRILLSSTDGKKLMDLASALRADKYLATVIHDGDINTAPPPIRAAYIKDEGETISLLNNKGEVILTIDQTTLCIAVLTAQKTEDLKQESITKAAAGGKAGKPTEDLLKCIFAMSPMMTVFSASSDTPIEIDSTHFDFTGLVRCKNNDAEQNFPVILEMINNSADLFLLDAYFGDTSLPFIHGDSTKDFRLYSRFILLCAKNGLFSEMEAILLTDHYSPLAAFDGLLITGPLFQEEIEIKIPTPPPFDTENAAQKTALPQETSFMDEINKAQEAIPGAIIMDRSIDGSILNRVPWAAPLMRPTWYGRWTSVTLSLLVLSPVIVLFTKNSIPVFLGLLSLGLVMFSHSLVLIKRKRDLENCPTSKIGTMPMGEVEVQGTARMHYLLKAPFSKRTCVYFKYEIYTTDLPRETIIEVGYSGNVPFIIEDDSGKALVLPKGAILQTELEKTFSSWRLRAKLESLKKYGDKVVETIIRPGTNLYVKGYAHRTQESAEKRTEKKLAKLRKLKADQKKMAMFDKNNDSKIDAHECYDIAKHIDEELDAEATKEKNAKDSVVIGEHPHGGLFYISTEPENKIIESIGLKIPFLLATGILLVSTSTLILLHPDIAQEIAKYAIKFFPQK
ncbi:MAG: hypothetical protein OEV59_01535 [Deltaproteobacteria bacterium]|nr:hypothetical protein [Deltaproteobacteria bacterium]